jgi:hypothetical protein
MGKVGIGTENPNYPLHVKGSSTNIFASAIQNLNSGNAAQGRLQFLNDRDSTAAFQGLLAVYSSTYSGTLDGVTLADMILLDTAGTNCQGMMVGTEAAAPLYLFTNSVRRMTVTSTGSILMNTYTTDGTMTFIGSVGKITSVSDERIKNSIKYFDTTGAFGYSYVIGPSGPTAYTSFTGYNSLPRILSLRPAQFKHNGYESNYEGFIAQQVEQHIPSAVDGKKYEYEFKKDEEGKVILDEEKNPVLNYDNPRYRGLNTTAILAHTVKALQELTEYQTKQIDRLADQITSLQESNANLTEQLQTTNTTLASVLSRLEILENN